MTCKGQIYLMFGKLKTGLLKVGHSYKSLPEKKQYLEFFTALLSVPVLMTVILLNLNNLNNSRKQPDKTLEPTPIKQVIYVSPKKDTLEKPSASPTPSVTDGCDEKLPAVSISVPSENDLVLDDPVNVIVDYKKENFCSVVWAYRINGSKWSDYDDKSIALYNLPSGSINLEVKIKSIVTGEERIIKRIFNYSSPSIEPTANISTDSAN